MSGVGYRTYVDTHSGMQCTFSQSPSNSHSITGIHTNIKICHTHTFNGWVSGLTTLEYPALYCSGTGSESTRTSYRLHTLCSCTHAIASLTLVVTDIAAQHRLTFPGNKNRIHDIKHFLSIFRYTLFCIEMSTPRSPIFVSPPLWRTLFQLPEIPDSICES